MQAYEHSLKENIEVSKYSHGFLFYCTDYINSSLFYRMQEFTAITKEETFAMDLQRQPSAKTRLQFSLYIVHSNVKLIRI